GTALACVYRDYEFSGENQGSQSAGSQPCQKAYATSTASRAAMTSSQPHGMEERSSSDEEIGTGTVCARRRPGVPAGAAVIRDSSDATMAGASASSRRA